MKIRRTMIAVAALMSFSAVAEAGCLMSHYYNHSPQPWTVRVRGGIATFSGCSGDPQKKVSAGEKCEVLPGKVVGAYGNKFTVEITDHLGKTRAFDVYAVPPPSPRVTEYCPKIRHSGNTGNVSVNDPADGDINMWGPAQW